MQGLLEVAGDRRAPGHEQVSHRGEEGVADLRQQWFQALANRLRGLIVAQVGGAHARRPQQLFLGLAAQGAGDRKQLLDPLPDAGLFRVPAQEPEWPQNAEQMGQWGGVVGQVPAHGDGHVARLGIQALHRLRLGGAQRPVGLVGQRAVEAGVPTGDHSGVGAVREPLTDELPDGFQHPAPGPEVGVVELDQAVPRQRLGQLQCLVLVQAGHPGGGGCGCVRSTMTRGGGHPPKFTLPRRREIKKTAKSRPAEYDLPLSDDDALSIGCLIYN